MINLIKKLPFYRRYTTKQNTNYWSQRKLGWDDYFKTADHPHRHFITNTLKQLNWISLFEIGCGSGPNIANLTANIKGKQMGGIDINPEAIEVCNKNFTGGHFRVGDASNLIMSDKSADIILSDAFLIYIGPFKINKYIKEMRRVARNYCVLVEFHHKSWWRRQWLRVMSGRHAYNWKKRLENYGFYDVETIKIPQFEEDNEQSYRHLIIARVPKLC